MDILSGVNWTSFMIAMFVIELTPGPNMGWLAALSAQTGRRAGMIAVLGITIGLSVQVVAAATGLSAIAAASDWLYHLLRWAGVGYMVYLAWCAWAESAEGVPPIRDENAFRRGLISNLLNPKALVFYMVVIGQFTSPQAGPIWLQTLLLGGLHVLTALIVHSAIVLLGAMIGTRLASWQSSVPVRLAFALSLLAIAIWIAISTGTIPNDIVDDAA